MSTGLVPKLLILAAALWFIAVVITVATSRRIWGQDRLRAVQIVLIDLMLGLSLLGQATRYLPWTWAGMALVVPVVGLTAVLFRRDRARRRVHPGSAEFHPR